MENEMLAELEKLNLEIGLEFDNIHDYLCEKERAVAGLIRGRMQMIQESIDERLEKSREGYQSKEVA